MIFIANWDARSGRPESVKARSSTRKLLRGAWGLAGRPWSTSRQATPAAPPQAAECQHAPLHLLWQIAELLGSDLTLLIPSRDEMLATSNTVEFEKAMMKQIEDFAKGGSARIKLLTGFGSKLNATIESPRADRNRMNRENLEAKAEKTLRDTDTFRVPVGHRQVTQRLNPDHGSGGALCESDYVSGSKPHEHFSNFLEWRPDGIWFESAG